jgi:hypothetical protein
MSALPAHTSRLVERLLSGYCRRICPPSARHAVLLDYRIEEERATLSEARLFCGVPGTHRRVDIAQFRYEPGGEWRLFYADETLRWRRYARRASSRSFVELLREVDADAEGAFWGRINGKSLRWCSARGRCDGCDEQYCRILGLIEREPAASNVLRISSARDRR